MTKEKIIVTPTTDILHSMRRTGYAWHEAVVDILDNGIDALREHHNNTGTKDGVVKILARQRKKVVDRLIIADNGTGMDEVQLREILRLGWSAKRGTAALGTFGMGLKTAGMALGSIITVLSTTSDTDALQSISWDIDKSVKKGKFEVEFDSSPPAAMVSLFEKEVGKGSGTMVIIDNLLPSVPASSGAITQTVNSKCENIYRHMLDPASPLGFHFPFNIKVGGKADFIATDHDPLLLGDANTKSLIGSANSFETFKYGNFEFQVRLAHARPGQGRKRRGDSLGQGMPSRMGFYFFREGRLISAGGYDLLKTGTAGHGKLSNVYGEISFNDSGLSSEDSLIKVDFGKKGVVIDEDLKQYMKKHIFFPHIKKLSADADQALKDLKKTDRSALMGNLSSVKLPVEEFGRARALPDKAAIAASVFSRSSHAPSSGRKNRKYRGSTVKVGNQDFEFEFEEVSWRGSPLAFDVEMTPGDPICKVLINVLHPWVDRNVYLSSNIANISRSLQVITALVVPWAHEENDQHKNEMLVKSSRLLEIIDVHHGELDLESNELEEDPEEVAFEIGA